MSIITILSLLLTLAYVLLIGTYVLGWHHLPTYPTPPSTYTPHTSLALIIPARNEAQYIDRCLYSIYQQAYPKHLLAVIVIDDHSTDETADLVKQWQTKMPYLQLLDLATLLPQNAHLNAYKKKAIELAIAQTQQTLIVTTDADSYMEKDWLRTVVSYYEQHAPNIHLLAAPVAFTKEQTFFQRFQTLDFGGMMVATGASVFFRLSNMCNGANLAYTRQAFYEVGGFKGIDDIASGDDMLLMHKIWTKYPQGIAFVKSLAATVFTYPEPTVAHFNNQRLRWASKSAKYQDKRITAFLAAVFLFNIFIVLTFIGGLLVNSHLLYLSAAMFMAKCLTDFVFLASAMHFFKRNRLLWLFLPAQILHVLYIIVIGTLGNFGTYTWKGREVK